MSVSLKAMALLTAAVAVTFSFGGRLQQQSEVTDGLVGVSHRGDDKPQLDSEFGASPVRRLRPTVDPGQ